jgi:hypothetical protein
MCEVKLPATFVVPAEGTNTSGTFDEISMEAPGIDVPKSFAFDVISSIMLLFVGFMVT